MSASNDLSSKYAVLQFLLWFRPVMLFVLSILSLTGLQDFAILPLILVILYNGLILTFRNVVLKTLLSRPFLLYVDILICFFILVNTGGYESPYYGYLYATIIFGAFLLGRFHVLALSITQAVSFILAVFINYNIYGIDTSGGSISMDVFLFVFAAFAFGFVAELLSELQTAQHHKALLANRYQEIRRRLELSLSSSPLSQREREVLLLSMSGKTPSKIATELEISTNTVKTYQRRAYEKLYATSKEEIISKLIGQDHG